MKIKSILLAGLIALGFMACNNEEAPDLGKQAAGTVSVKVVPSSKEAGARATDNLTGDGISSPGLEAESAIKVLEVYVFDNGTGALDGYGKAENKNKVEKIDTHAGNKTIMVVTNANIGAVATKAALEAKTKEVPVTITDGLVMTGEASVALLAGQNYYGYSGTNEDKITYLEANPLKITRVNARVAIADAKLEITDPGQQAIFDALANVEVAIFNVPKATKLFGSSLATNANFLFGEVWPSTQGSYVNVAANATPVFKDAVTLPILVSNAPYYYVTENTSTALTPAKEQMLIVLRGKPTIGDPATPVTAEGLYTDTNGYTYYPVWVNKDGVIDGDGTVKRNTQYNIYLTIKGIGNPSIDEVEEAFLDVKVEVEHWAVVNQSVEW